MSVTSGETLNCRKEFRRVDTPLGLASSVVGVAHVLDVRAVFCLGGVYMVGCKAAEEQSETMTVLAIRVLPVFPLLDPGDLLQALWNETKWRECIQFISTPIN